MTGPIIWTNLGAGSSLCGILLLLVLAARLCCRVTTMQAASNQKGETPKRIEANSEPPELQQAPLSGSLPSFINPTLMEEETEEKMKKFSGVVELECLHPTCKECTSMREEVFWEGR